MPKSICAGCKHSTEPAPTCRACSLAHAAAVKRLARRVAKLERLLQYAVDAYKNAVDYGDNLESHDAELGEAERILARRARAKGQRS